MQEYINYLERRYSSVMRPTRKNASKKFHNGKEYTGKKTPKTEHVIGGKVMSFFEPVTRADAIRQTLIELEEAA